MRFPGQRQSPEELAEPSPPGRLAARLACGVGLLFAAISAYWGLGGTWLVDTVGADLAAKASDGELGPRLVSLGAAAAKVVAAILPLLAIRQPRSGGRGKLVRVLCWVEAVILTTYGMVLTAVGLLVQAGVVDSTGGDHKALAWHAYLWDPWFLIWGLLVTTALMQSRVPRRSSRSSAENPEQPHGRR